jgi:hypothetical protein
VISGSGELRAPEGSDYTFVNSDYTYTGSGTITGNIFYFQIVQETKPSTPGVAYLSVEGYFDLTTGLGESTLTECTGLELICDKVTPLPSTDSYSTGPLTDNNGNLIDSAEDLDGIEYFTWSQSSEIDPGYGGLASTTSEYKASVPTRADDDGDGVSNELDQCPNTPEGAVVDISTGCQLDDDGDRVFNEDDDCPDTIETIVDEHGCPRDTDGDDVFDDYDQCPNENFDVDADGCTLDTDRDLVRDAVPDRCPDTPLNTDVSAEGCPLDDLDGDGVLNTTPDVCPNTYLAPELVGPDGCALTDPDNDNVENDGTDLCPSTPSVAAANVDADGCALVLNIVGQQDDASIPTVGGLDPNAYTVYYLEGEPVDDGVTTPHSTASVPTAPSFTGTYNPETDAYTLNVDNYTIVVNVPLFPTWIKNPVTNITHVSDGSTGTVASKNDLIANATGVISITSTAVNCSVPGSPPPVTTGFCAAPAIAPYTVLTDLSWDGTTGNITTIINLGTQGGLQTITYTFTEAP